MDKAVFLDRDGVINVDHGYTYLPENFQFIDGVFEACQRFQSQGYRLVIVTNQSGIGRGYYTEAQFHILTEWMINQFKNHNVVIDKVYFCPFHAEAGIGRYKQDSPLRKPNPGMLLQAAQDLRLDMASSVMIGDKMSDIEAGRNAGVGRCILIDSNPLKNNKDKEKSYRLKRADLIAKNLVNVFL